MQTTYKLHVNCFAKYIIRFSFESTALRLITSLGSSGVQLQMSRVVSEPKSCVVVSSESEELNRVLVLTLARGIYMTGTGESFSSSMARYGRRL